jgi:hypothetical protein
MRAKEFMIVEDTYSIMANRGFDEFVRWLRRKGDPRSWWENDEAMAYFLLREAIDFKLVDAEHQALMDQAYQLAMKEAFGEDWNGDPQGWEKWSKARFSDPIMQRRADSRRPPEIGDVVGDLARDTGIDRGDIDGMLNRNRRK